MTIEATMTEPFTPTPQAEVVRQYKRGIVPATVKAKGKSGRVQFYDVRVSSLDESCGIVNITVMKRSGTVKAIFANEYEVTEWKDMP